MIYKNQTFNKVIAFSPEEPREHNFLVAYATVLQGDRRARIAAYSYGYHGSGSGSIIIWIQP